MRSAFVLSVAAGFSIITGCAQPSHDLSAGAKESESAMPSSRRMSEGEVRKIDLSTGMLTLHSGPIENLRMPEMTMMFAVVDPRMLEIVKKGDSVRFTADLVEGKIAVTHLEVVK